MESEEEHSKISSRGYALDLSMVLILLGWFAVPLILLRGSPTLAGWPWRIGFTVGTLLLLALWQKLGRRLHEVPLPSPAPEPFWRKAVTVGLLAVLTYVSFFIPLTMHFWGGGDDLQVLISEFWHSGFDRGLSRPLNVTFLWLGLQLTPDRVEGQLIVAALLCLGNGVFLMCVLKELFPSARLLPVAAGVMMILNRGDLSRFTIMWTTSLYWGPLCFLLLAVWLWLVSSRRRSRLLLFAACFFLGCALLGTEGLFPLAGSLSLLVYRYWQDRRHGTLWLAAWVGTVGLFTARFLQFLLASDGNSYQFRQTKGAQGKVDVLQSLKVHLTAILEYLKVQDMAWEYWLAGLAVFVLVLLMLWLSRGMFAGAAQPSRKTIWLAVFGAAAAMVLGFLPFLHIPHLFRTHFLASAGESFFYAALLCLLGALLPLRWRGIGSSILIAAMAGLACMATFTGQRSDRRLSGITFEKLVHVFHQIHSLSPQLPPDTVLLFVLDDGVASPLGGTYHVHRMSEMVLGPPSFVINGSETDVTAKVGPKGIIPTYPEATGSEEYGFERLVAFRVSYDGTTRLITELPPALITEAPDAARLYRPLDRLRPGALTEMRLLRMPSWSDGVPDLFDFTPGVTFGQGWGERRVSKNDKLSREFQNDAEIWVNPAGRTRIEISLNIKPDTENEGVAVDFTVRDEKGASVMQTRLPKEGRTLVKLDLDPTRLHRFRFNFAAADAGARPLQVLKAYRPGTVERTTVGRKRSDVTEAGTVLGNNWHPLERYEGLTFRWVTNDAEIKPGVWATSVNTLNLAVEGGPGVGEKGGTLELRNQAGEVLGSAHIREYTEIKFPLPRPPLPNEVYRLHIEGGGLPSPRGEPRILNFRVFQCSLEQRIP